jgi:ketose-bisphosphate aldolase
MNLNYYLKWAKENQKAIGHFNFASLDVLKAIVAGAKEAGAPAVMVGTSEGEVGFVGMKEAVAMVKSVSEDLGLPVFLNSDHFKSFEKCKEAIDAGYDSILIDASKLPYEENVALTKKVKDYAMSVNPEIGVEGEIGYLRGSSEVQSKVEISIADYTQPDQAKDFLEKTGVDRLAVVFGNIHGIVTEQEEKLDIDHLKKIVAAVPEVPIVLHGASGVSDQDVADAIKAGVANVHFNTELRVAYTKSIQESMQSHPEETTPYKYMEPAAEEVKKLVKHKTELFMK